MTAHEQEEAARPVELNEDDVAFLLSFLRDPAKSHPVTTQDLIDALRKRPGR